jgi:hypothetical protein
MLLSRLDPFLAIISPTVTASFIVKEIVNGKYRIQNYFWHLSQGRNVKRK